MALIMKDAGEGGKFVAGCDLCERSYYLASSEGYLAQFDMNSREWTVRAPNGEVVVVPEIEAAIKGIGHFMGRRETWRDRAIASPLL
jgi:hypothetical protein